MKKRTGKREKITANQDALLALLLVFSLIFFFLSLQLIPDRAGKSMHTFLCASAMLLFLIMPSFFFLHFADTREKGVLGNLPSPHMVWRMVVFSLGALCLGVFANRFSGLIGWEQVLLFPAFGSYESFSLSSLSVFLTYSFVSAFLPFGILHSRLSSASCVSAVLSMALLYAALGFSVFSAPLLFVFGCFLALQRIQSGSFLNAFVCNLFFMLGAYADRIGLFGLSGLPLSRWMLLAAAGGIGGLLSLAALDYHYFRKLSKSSEKSVRRAWTPWFWIVILLLGAVLALVAVFGGKK